MNNMLVFVQRNGACTEQFLIHRALRAATVSLCASFWEPPWALPRERSRAIERIFAVPGSRRDFRNDRFADCGNRCQTNDFPESCFENRCRTADFPESCSESCSKTEVIPENRSDIIKGVNLFEPLIKSKHFSEIH